MPVGRGIAPKRSSMAGVNDFGGIPGVGAEGL